MGYQAYPKLVLGATALSIFGEIEKETDKLPRFTRLGKQDGHIQVHNQFLTAPNGYRFHVGSTAWDGEENRYGLEFRFNNLFVDDSDRWIHYSDYESGNTNQIIIGLSIGKDEVDQAHVSHELGGVGYLRNEVATTLANYFGYHGETRIFAQLRHSY